MKLKPGTVMLHAGVTVSVTVTLLRCYSKKWPAGQTYQNTHTYKPKHYDHSQMEKIPLVISMMTSMMRFKVWDILD